MSDTARMVEASQSDDDGGAGVLTRVRRTRGEQFVRHATQYGIWVVLVGFLVYCVVDVQNFATRGNIGDILAAVPFLGVAALGQTFVIAGGGMDLSVGQVASLSGVLTAGLVSSSGQLIWAVPMALVIGVAAGLLNGAAIAVSRANPVMITFGMLSVLEGATYLYSQVSVGKAPDALSWVDSRRLAGVIPVSSVVLAAVAVGCWLLLNRAVFGNHVRAVGGNEASALRSGIKTTRIKLAMYALSGLSGAVAGLLLVARLKTGYPAAGTGLELSAIVAVILGGTPFGGGKASIPGTIAGVLLLSTVANALSLLAVGAEVQHIINGLVVAGAVALYSTKRSGRWT